MTRLPQSSAFQDFERVVEGAIRPDGTVEELVCHFVVRDRGRRTLRAYRDHYGARPLYYTASEGRVRVSSSLPALLKGHPVPPSLDEAALLEYLARCSGTD